MAKIRQKTEQKYDIDLKCAWSRLSSAAF